VTQSAQQAGLYLSMGGSALDLGGATSSFTIEVKGALGSRSLTFTSGTTLENIAKAINSFKDVTGVEATASATSEGISLTTVGFGSNEFVSLQITDDGGIGSAGNIGVYNFQPADFNTVSATRITSFDSSLASNGVQDRGIDMGATINGIKATSDGKTARINTDFLDVELTLVTSQAQALGAVGASQAFTITGGGADFQLAAQVNIAGKVSIGIADVATRKLGNSTLGFLGDLAAGKQFNVVDGDDFSGAQKVVNSAIEQVASLRGRLGAFQKNTVGATIRSLSVASENTSAAESIIRDADFASETAQLTRNQILVAASTNVLALANQSPQSALQLLG
jgi:flagellin